MPDPTTGKEDAMQDGYHAHGVPLEAYQLTKADHRAQSETERSRQWAREQAAKAPPWSDETWRSINALVRGRVPIPAHMLMRWRVRLYCGHIVELTRSIEDKNPFGLCFTDHRCPRHDNREQVIVAYEPLGRLAPPDTSAAPLATRRETSAQRIKRLEAENIELRAEVERHSATSDRSEP